MAEYVSIKEIQDMQPAKGVLQVSVQVGRFIGLFKKDDDWAHIFECDVPNATKKNYECIIGKSIISSMIMTTANMMGEFEPAYLNATYAVCRNILAYMQAEKLYFEVTFYKLQDFRGTYQIAECTIERLQSIREKPVVKEWLDALAKYKTATSTAKTPSSVDPTEVSAPVPVSVPTATPIAPAKTSTQSLSPANQTLGPTHLCPKDQRRDSLQKRIGASNGFGALR
jgi:hypothetical protein